MISFVVPVYKKPEITYEFLFKLFPKLAGDDEIIVVDNACDPATLGIVKQFNRGVRYFGLEKNYGFGAANNIGAKLAKNNIICFISNDVMVEGSIETIKNCGDDLYGARYINFDTGWNVFNGILIPYLEGWCIWTKKYIFEKIGYWDERFFIDYEDVDLSLTASKLGIKLVEISIPFRHLGSQTASQLGVERLKYTLESKEKLINKWKLI